MAKSDISALYGSFIPDRRWRPGRYGNIQGWFKALDAKTGEELWKFNAGSGISQGAITFELDGKQYIAVVSGRLKTPPSFLGHTGERIFASSPEGGALFVFELAD